MLELLIWERETSRCILTISIWIIHDAGTDNTKWKLHPPFVYFKWYFQNHGVLIFSDDNRHALLIILIKFNSLAGLCKRGSMFPYLPGGFPHPWTSVRCQILELQSSQYSPVFVHVKNTNYIGYAAHSGLKFHFICCPLNLETILISILPQSETIITPETFMLTCWWTKMLDNII